MVAIFLIHIIKLSIENVHRCKRRHTEKLIKCHPIQNARLLSHLGKMPQHQGPCESPSYKQKKKPYTFNN